MVNDWLVHFYKERKTSSDPIVILLADSNIYKSLSAALALFTKGQEFEDQRNRLSSMQEKGIVLANHIVAFGLSVVAESENRYCSDTK